MEFYAQETAISTLPPRRRRRKHGRDVGTISENFSLARRSSSALVDARARGAHFKLTCPETYFSALKKLAHWIKKPVPR